LKETFKGAVLFAEALERVKSVLGNLKISIYGFQDDLIKYKGFDEKLDDKIKEEMSMMEAEVGNNGEHNQASYNNDGYCLDKVSKLLEETESENKFLFVLSDGEPASDSKHHIQGYGKSTEDEELLTVVKNISEKTNQKLLGIGLGPGTEHVEEFYSKKFKNVDNLPNIGVKDLADKLASKLEELIK